MRQHLGMSDNEVLAGIYKCYVGKNSIQKKLAKRIVERNHFRLLYSRNPEDVKINSNAMKNIFETCM